MTDPSKEALKKAWREQENQKKLASIPMPKEALKELFEHLDRALSEDCDHSLRFTTSFLECKKLDVQRVVAWLHDHGDYCDCEVLANVEDEFGDLL